MKRTCSPHARVSCVKMRFSISTIQMSLLPERSEQKTRCLPSGESENELNAVQVTFGQRMDASVEASSLPIDAFTSRFFTYRSIHSCISHNMWSRDSRDR